MALNCKWIFGIPGIYFLLQNMNPRPLAVGGTTQARKMVAAGEGAPAPSTRAASQPRAVVVQESVGEQSRAEQIRKPACCWVVLLRWPSQHYLPLANSFRCNSAPCSCALISGVFGRSWQSRARSQKGDCCRGAGSSVWVFFGGLRAGFGGLCLAGVLLQGEGVPGALLWGDVAAHSGTAEVTVGAAWGCRGLLPPQGSTSSG